MSGVLGADPEKRSILTSSPNAGLAFAAAQPSLLLGAREHPSPPGVAFELLGVDFVVDADLHPWLLEVNAVPSMARQVCHLCLAALHSVSSIWWPPNLYRSYKRCSTDSLQYGLICMGKPCSVSLRSAGVCL